MKPRILISRAESSAAEFYVAALYGVGCIADSIYAPMPDEGYDGLLLAGGGDVDPAFYGEENTASKGIDRVRDEAELRLCEYFVKQGKPILGICRGHQLLNVYFGGSLHQHIYGHTVPNSSIVHETRAEHGSLMCKLFGEAFTVNSIHHQSVKDVGLGLRVTQIGHDGTVEALEHKSMPVVGVQWHPERMCLARRRDDTVDSLPLFEHFASFFK